MDYIKRIENLVEESQDYDIRFDHPGGWALHEDACRFLGIMIKKFQLTNVLEFGSGFSSLVIADELERQGKGFLISIDSSKYYSKIASQRLLKHGLNYRASFYVFSIWPKTYHRKVLLFYDIPGDFWKNFECFDLVLVDGPPHDFGREATLYEAFDHTRIGGFIIVDDANRRGMEMVYAKAWQHFFGESLIMTHIKDVGLGLYIIKKMYDKPSGQAFSFYDLSISFFKTSRNFLRKLRYGDEGKRYL